MKAPTAKTFNIYLTKFPKVPLNLFRTVQNQKIQNNAFCRTWCPRKKQHNDIMWANYAFACIAEGVAPLTYFCLNLIQTLLSPYSNFILIHLLLTLFPDCYEIQCVGKSLSVLIRVWANWKYKNWLFRWFKMWIWICEISIEAYFYNSLC